MSAASTGSATFLLGLGAQKAGSTWVQDYIAADPQACFGPIKEYHVWDVLHLHHATQFDCRRGNILSSRCKDLARRLLGKGPDKTEIRRRLQTKPEAYFDFFETLLARDGVRLTGDFTPLYAGLPVDVLTRIRDGFRDRGIAVRAVFLMRDPVARCVSAAQMNRRKGGRNEAVIPDGDLDTAVLAYVGTSQERLRADYRRTVETLRAAFAEDEIFFGLYETLFTFEETARLSRFVGIEHRPELAAKRVNDFPKREQVSRDTLERLRAVLADDYEYCAQAFPQSTDHWRGDFQ